MLLVRRGETVEPHVTDGGTQFPAFSADEYVGVAALPRACRSRKPLPHPQRVYK